MHKSTGRIGEQIFPPAQEPPGCIQRSIQSFHQKTPFRIAAKGRKSIARDAVSFIRTLRSANRAFQSKPASTPASYVPGKTPHTQHASNAPDKRPVYRRLWIHTKSAAHKSAGRGLTGTRRANAPHKPDHRRWGIAPRPETDFLTPIIIQCAQECKRDIREICRDIREIYAGISGKYAEISGKYADIGKYARAGKYAGTKRSEKAGAKKKPKRPVFPALRLCFCIILSKNYTLEYP